MIISLGGGAVGAQVRGQTWGLRCEGLGSSLLEQGWGPGSVMNPCQPRLGWLQALAHLCLLFPNTCPADLSGTNPRHCRTSSINPTVSI